MDFGFGVGYSEMFVLAIIAVIVIGPKDLPVVLRTFGQFMRKARGMAREFQGHVDVAMKEAGVDGLKKDLGDLKSTINTQASAPAKSSVPAAYSAYNLSGAAKDFETYFGSTGSTGETRVAGTLLVTPEPTSTP
jgi:sec-independent protein translocase protein TatB